MAEKHNQILIVDDEESIRSLLNRFLERHGYDCYMASDGAQARECLEDRSFDLLLCDIMMPGESGIDLIRHVSTAYSDTAVIMVTAVYDQDIAREALEIGIYGYILKPFDENQILISVANALRRRDLERKERTYRENLKRAIQKRTAELVEVNDELRVRETQLSKQTEELKDMNSALKVLLKKREEDRAVLEENILSNVKNVVEPYLERLRQSQLDNEQMNYLSILDSNLSNIVSPLVRELSSKYLNLTPTEIQVADLIKQGKRTKEIAAILNLSENTIVSHRYNIRTKLGLKRKKTNLQSYLQSIK